MSDTFLLSFCLIFLFSLKHSLNEMKKGLSENLFFEKIESVDFFTISSSWPTVLFIRDAFLKTICNYYNFFYCIT